MSSIASLYNVPTPGQIDQLNTWGFAHMAHHRDVIRVIYLATKIALPEFPLDQINPEDTETWSDLHQQMHNDMNNILGISGFNLLDVNWKDTGALTGWINLNANEHYQAANILQIG